MVVQREQNASGNEPKIHRNQQMYEGVFVDVHFLNGGLIAGKEGDGTDGHNRTLLGIGVWSRPFHPGGYCCSSTSEHQPLMKRRWWRGWATRILASSHSPAVPSVVMERLTATCHSFWMMIRGKRCLLFQQPWSHRCCLLPRSSSMNAAPSYRQLNAAHETDIDSEWERR